MRQLANIASVGVHRVDVEVAVTRRREDDLFAVAADGGLRIVARACWSAGANRCHRASPCRIL